MRLKIIAEKTMLPLEKILIRLEYRIAFLKHKQRKVSAGRPRNKIRGRKRIYEKELRELLLKERRV